MTQSRSQSALDPSTTIGLSPSTTSTDLQAPSPGLQSRDHTPSNQTDQRNPIRRPQPPTTSHQQNAPTQANTPSFPNFPQQQAPQQTSQSSLDVNAGTHSATHNEGHQANIASDIHNAFSVPEQTGSKEEHKEAAQS